jgi:16S rRNA (cytosine1407-C5)-methyltransferase
MKFKKKFIEKYKGLTNFEEYSKAVNKFSRKSIRVNTLKFSFKDLKSLKDWKLEKVPWCKDGFFVEHVDGRLDIGNTDEHKKGMFFSQNASSMIPAQFMKANPRSLVLDMCAAPGGKSHHLACLMKNKGKIVANEPNTYRRNVMKLNLDRCGVKNIRLDNQEAEKYMCGELFDSVLIDAPCSGSGMIMGNIARSKKLVKEWNPHVIKKYAKLQGKLLDRAYDCLKKKGRIVYATCSLEPEEDEDVVEKFLGEHKDCKLVVVENVCGFKVKSSCKKYIKVWPQYYGTIGFFVAVIDKN